MNKVKLVAASVGILAGAACAAPWYTGMQTEQKMRAGAEALGADRQSPVAVSYTRFDRGWLSSVAVTRVSLKADPTVYVDVRHEISHKPDRTSWVHVHSVPQWTGELKARFDYYFDGQPPLTVDTVYNYDGTQVSRFTSPAFSKPLQERPETTVTWGGMSGTLSADANSHWSGSATVPSVAVEGGDTQAELSELKIEGVWDIHGTTIDWQGETKLGIADLRFVAPLQQIALQNIAGSFYQRTQGNSLLIGYGLRVGSGTSAHAGEVGQTVSNAVLELEFDKLDKRSLSKYLADLGNAEKLHMAPEARGRLMAQLALTMGADLLRGSPEMRLKKLGVETPSGAVLAHASVAFDGSNMPDMPLSPELMTRIKAKADLKISGTLLRTQLQQQVRSKVEVTLSQQGSLGTEENIRALSEKVIEEQLKGFTDAGLLRASGGDFIVEAEFAAGRILVNGVPANQLFGGIFAAPPAPTMPQEKAPQSEAALPASSVAAAEPRAMRPDTLR
jgi:uncharacterized protein YdgA (DUF945 family)